MLHRNYKATIKLKFIILLFTPFYLQPLNAQKINIASIPQNQETIKLDGILNEPAWNKVYEINNFKLVEPRLNGEPTEKATAKIFYTDKYIFVGIHCPNKNLQTVYAQVMERDISLDADDYAEVQLDTYNDKASSLVFRTNPLGTRFDYEISNNGEGINSSWNTFWDVATHRDADGWKAEFRIPFYSLRFQKNTENNMRVKVLIKYKTLNEKLIYPLNNQQVIPVIYNFQNSQEISFKNIKPSNPLFITPYIKADVLQQNKLNASNTAYQSGTQWLTQKNYSKNESFDKVISNIGVDMKYRINNSNVLDVSFNTDFAQVEADDRLINVTRFSINLPEKRPFFLENADIFNSDGFSHRLFNSRQIGIDNSNAVPIIGGMRLNGFSGRNQYGLLSVLTKPMDEKQLDGYSMNVLRARRVLDNKGSNIGLITTGKISTTGNDYNFLTGVDGFWRWKNGIRVFYVAAATFDKQTGNWKPLYAAGIGRFKTNGFGFEYRLQEYNKNFNPELGFQSEPDTRRITLNNNFQKSFKQHKLFTFYRLGHFVRKSWQSSTGRQDFFQTNFYVVALFKNGFSTTIVAPAYIIDYIYTPWIFSANATIPTGTYNMWKFNPSFTTGSAFRYIFSLDVLSSGFYGGKQLSVNFSSGYDLNKNVKVEVGGSINRFKFPGSYMSNGTNTVNINRLFSRVKLAFSNKAFLNLYAQYDNVQKSLGWNLRFRYMPKEGTDFYVVYNLNSNTETNSYTPEKPFVNNQLFILKFSKTFIQ